jgi:hypothetical protein
MHLLILFLVFVFCVFSVKFRKAVFIMVSTCILIGGIIAGAVYGYEYYKRQQYVNIVLPSNSNDAQVTMPSGPVSDALLPPIEPAKTDITWGKQSDQPSVIIENKQVSNSTGETATDNTTAVTVEKDQPIQHQDDRLPVVDSPAVIPPTAVEMTSEQAQEQSQIDFQRNFKCIGLDSAAAIRKCRYDFDNEQ